MRTGEYRRFFDKLQISYPAGTSKATFERAYKNYWKNSEKNIYIRLPMDIKNAIKEYLVTPSLRTTVKELKDKIADGSFVFNFGVNVSKLHKYSIILKEENRVLRTLKKIAVKKTIKSFL